MITTEAWVLDRGPDGSSSSKREPGVLRKELYTLPDLSSDEVLVEPIYGCWEGNMAHALAREPVDICRQRGEEKVVIGNAGVVRILKVGSAAQALKKDDLCLVFCNGDWDESGYAKKIYAYDAPGTVGLLAKQTKLNEKQLIKLPARSQHTPEQWAAFSLRYITAWANWKLAFGCWQLQTAGATRLPPPSVWGWGGGVAFAELSLAQLAGFQSVLITSDDQRRELIEQVGLRSLDRRKFQNLNFDHQRYKTDSAYRKAYQEAEDTFLALVQEHTLGLGVSIFVDFIGAPVLRATLKALRRPGIITTAGWKEGMNISMLRALECMNWHIHVHTHYARRDEAQEAVSFGESRGWMPTLHGEPYQWDDIPQLAHDYAENKLSTYFPIFQVNPL